MIELKTIEKKTLTFFNPNKYFNFLRHHILIFNLISFKFLKFGIINENKYYFDIKNISHFLVFSHIF